MTTSIYRYISILLLTQTRKKLIQLILSGKWTIRAAAKKTGIKLCTAKYIYYNFKRKGKLYEKNRGIQTFRTQEKLGNMENVEQDNIVYVPYPVYVFCCYNTEQPGYSFQQFSYM